MWDAETDEERTERGKRKRKCGGNVAGSAPKERLDRKARGGRLTTEDRKKMPASEFAAGKGHFPINDKKHARLAISGATRSERAGNISSGEEAKIKAKARAKLAD